MPSLSTRRIISLLVFFLAQILLLVSVSLFDYWIEVHWGPEATISRAMRDAPPLLISLFYLVVGIVVGGLTFHFFFPQSPKTNDPYSISEQCAQVADKYITSDSQASQIAKEIRNLKFK